MGIRAPRRRSGGSPPGGRGRGWDQGGGGLRVVPQGLLKVAGAEPLAELEAAAVELARQGIAQAVVEADAGVRPVGRGLWGPGDAGADGPDALGPGELLQGMVEAAAQALAPDVPADVDAGLHDPAVGGTGPEGAGVGVAKDLAVPLGHEVGVFRGDGGDPAAELFGVRGLILKGDGGLPDVGGVDGGEGGGVALPDGTEADIGHWGSVLPCPSGGPGRFLRIIAGSGPGRKAVSVAIWGVFRYDGKKRIPGRAPGGKGRPGPCVLPC